MFLKFYTIMVEKSSEFCYYICISMTMAGDVIAYIFYRWSDSQS